MVSARPLVWLLLVALAGTGSAQEVAFPRFDPAASAAPQSGAAAKPADDLDLANVVTSTAKAITTVQEVPAIVTVLTAEDLRRRGLRFLDEALAAVPGWLMTSLRGTAVPTAMVRGVPQAALLLHDGLSMFDPWMNWGSFNRTQPLETLKRIEVVTGPGGVLWGANSFLGIVNLISKDAEDVNGVEVSAGYGDGDGDKQHARAYALFGKTFFGGKLKLFQHVSFDSYIGPVWRLPKVILPSTFGAAIKPDPERSWIVTLDGKYSLGPVTLYYSVPFAAMSAQESFLNVTDGRGRMTIFDRYGILEYQKRLFADRLALTVRGTYTQFVREIDPRVYPESAVLPAYTDPMGRLHPGGFTIDTNALVQRYGGSIDGDLSLPFHLRLLGGAEAFEESIRDATIRILSPAGGGYLGFICPTDAMGNAIPQCPRPAVDDVGRVVLGGYLDLQWRPVQPLILEAGARLQQAFGRRPYALTPLYSAAAVWNFYPGYHLKLNYATGFRPPAFNYTDATKGGLQFGSNPKLLNERSQAFQGELNGRLLRNRGLFRELELRADYSYTKLDNVIELAGALIGGGYRNGGQRAIHSVEGQARAYLVGDHFIELGYTYLYSISASDGYVRNVPSQWVTLATSISVIRHLLEVNANLAVYASFEDPNLYPSGPGGLPGSTSSTRATDVTFDRIYPTAVAQVGAHLHLFHDRIGLSAQLFNVFNQRYWLPDSINEIRPHMESVSTPAPGFSFFTSITYRPF